MTERHEAERKWSSILSKVDQAWEDQEEQAEKVWGGSYEDYIDTVGMIDPQKAIKLLPEIPQKVDVDNALMEEPLRLLSAIAFMITVEDEELGTNHSVFRDKGGEMETIEDPAETETLRRRELYDGLVLPEYKKFCREAKLNLVFSQEELSEKYDAQFVYDQQVELHKQAMSLFNRMKTKYHYFNGSVVEFSFLDWSGDFLYQDSPIEEFLRHVEQRDSENEQLKKLCLILGIMAGCFGYVATTLILVNLLARIPPDSLFGLLGLFFYAPPLLMLLSPMLAFVILKAFQKRRDASVQRKLQTSLQRLRERIDQVKGEALKRLQAKKIEGLLSAIRRNYEDVCGKDDEK